MYRHHVTVGHIIGVLQCRRCRRVVVDARVDVDVRAGREGAGMRIHQYRRTYCDVVDLAVNVVIRAFSSMHTGQQQR